MNWQEFLSKEQSQPYYSKIRRALDEAKEWGESIFPPEHQRFAAFEVTPFEDVKVVILGQDPYPTRGQANGLAFSVDVLGIPPSLRNIFTEIEDDLQIKCCSYDGNLIRWAKQGVFLLNVSLSVTEGQANSHSNIGWSILTDNAIRALNDNRDGIVFLLWGRFAQAKQRLITNPTHMTLMAAHPSSLSAYRGFFGCKHFSKANEFLAKAGHKYSIDWR